MPWTLHTEDGITIEGIPDTVYEDDPALQAKVDKARSATREQAMFNPPQAGPTVEADAAARAERAAEQPPEERDLTLSDVGGALTRGLAPIAVPAAVGAALAGPAAPVGAAIGAGLGGAVKLADAIIRAVNEHAGTKYGELGPYIQQGLTAIGIAEPQSDAGKAIQRGAETVADVGSMTGAAGMAARYAARPTIRAVGEVLASQPVSQLTSAAGGAAAAPVGREISEQLELGPKASMAVELGTELAGSVLGARAGRGLRVEAPRMAEVKPVLEAAEREGVKLTTSNVVPPRTFMGRSLQALGNRIPIAGTGKKLAEQQGDRIRAVKRLLKDYGAATDETAESAVVQVSKDLSDNRREQINHWTGIKREVMERLNTVEPARAPKAIAAIDAEIEQLSRKSPELYAPAISKLQTWRNALDKPNTLLDVDDLRDTIGDSYDAPDLASIKTVAEKAINRIYHPLREDIGDFIEQHGGKEDLNAWSNANRKLHGMVGELKMRSLKATLNAANVTPEDAAKMLFSTKSSEIRQLHSGLTPRGRVHARVAVLKRATEKSIAADTDEISPDRFANEVKRLGKSVGVVFEGADYDRVRGLGRVLKASKYAMQASAHPPTGVQTMAAAPYVIYAALSPLLGPALAGAAVGGIGGIARLYESKGVRDILLKLPRVKAGSPEENALLKRFAALPIVHAAAERHKGESRETAAAEE